MFTFSRTTILLAALLGASPIWAQQLWQGTTYGMTPAQALAVLPDAKPPKTPETMGGGALVEKLRIDKVDVGNHSFEAHLFFKDEKLAQVSLGLIPRRPYAETMVVFNTMLDLLRVKYGPEVGRDSTPAGGLRGAEATWASGKTVVYLIAIGTGNGNAFLNINYGPTPNAAGKL